MGTKLNPGKFDYYSDARPNEPMFTLLARDPVAPLLIEIWCMLRETISCQEYPHRNHDAKIIEAKEVAKSMIEWKAKEEYKYYG